MAQQYKFFALKMGFTIPSPVALVQLPTPIAVGQELVIEGFFQKGNATEVIVNLQGMSPSDPQINIAYVLKTISK